MGGVVGRGDTIDLKNRNQAVANESTFKQL